MYVKIAALALLAAFYASYILKLLLLRRRSVTVDILGKGEKPRGGAILEILLKGVTYLGAAAQFVSVMGHDSLWSFPAHPAARGGGLVLMVLGTLAFLLAISAMQDNWRAGYARGQNTRLVTCGIYRYSRNPAFLGFGLLYAGWALAFPSPVHAAVAAVAMVLFHLQILGEEKFLADAFGREYQDYKTATMRYLGRRVRSCKF